MARGRNKKPKEVKDLQGTSRKDRENENRMEPMRMVSVPEPPYELGDDGKKLWDRQLKQLVALNMLTVIDLAALYRYCRAWEDWLENDRKIRDGELTNKHDQVSTYYTARKDANATMLKFEDRFGFLPSAREKISMPEKGNSEDPLEAHLNKKTG